MNEDEARQVFDRLTDEQKVLFWVRLAFFKLDKSLMALRQELEDIADLDSWDDTIRMGDIFSYRCLDTEQTFQRHHGLENPAVKELLPDYVNHMRGLRGLLLTPECQLRTFRAVLDMEPRENLLTVLNDILWRK